MKASKKKHRNPGMTRTESLECKPIKNMGVTEMRLETGEVVLTYAVEMKPWFTKLVQRFGGPSIQAQTKKLQLDTLGTAVWELMDGKRTVRQITHDFAKSYQLHTREAEVSVFDFLRNLGKRGIIGLK